MAETSTASALRSAPSARREVPPRCFIAAVLFLAARGGGGGAPVAEAGLALGGAFGDGLAHGLAGMEIVAFDTLGAPFWYALDSFAVPAPDPSAAARLEVFMAPAAGRDTGLLGPGFVALAGEGAGSAALSMGRMEPAGGHLALASEALAARFSPAGGPVVTTFSTEGRQNPAPVSGVVLSWQLPDTPLMLGGGLAAEPARQPRRWRLRVAVRCDRFRRHRGPCAVRPLARPRRRRTRQHPGDLLAGLAVASPSNIDALCSGTAADTGLVLPASFVAGFLGRDDLAVRGAAFDLAPPRMCRYFGFGTACPTAWHRSAARQWSRWPTGGNTSGRDKLITALANAPSAAISEALGAIGDDEAIVALGHFAIRHSAAAPGVIAVLRYLVHPRADRLAARLEAECARPITGNASNVAGLRRRGARASAPVSPALWTNGGAGDLAYSSGGRAPGRAGRGGCSNTVDEPFALASEDRIFRSLFAGQEDIFPQRWKNTRTRKSGCALACTNEWKPGLCSKPRLCSLFGDQGRKAALRGGLRPLSCPSRAGTAGKDG